MDVDDVVVQLVAEESNDLCLISDQNGDEVVDTMKLLLLQDWEMMDEENALLTIWDAEIGSEDYQFTDFEFCFDDDIWGLKSINHIPTSFNQ